MSGTTQDAQPTAIPVSPPPAAPQTALPTQATISPSIGQSETAPGFAPIFVGHDDEQPADSPAPGVSLKDFGKIAWGGLVNAGASIVDMGQAVDRATGGSDANATAQLQLSQQLHNYADSISQHLSPGAQRAMKSSLFNSGSDPNAPSVGQVGVGNYLAATLASAVPDTAVGVGAAALAPVTAGTSLAAGAAYFGAKAGGEEFHELVGRYDSASDAEMRQIPGKLGQGYTALRAQGESEADAKKWVVGQAAPMFVAAQAGVGSITALGTEGMLTRPLSKGVGMLARTGINAAAGAGVGAIASGGQDAIQQAGDIQSGKQQGFNVGQAAAAAGTGAVGGAVMGGGAGAIHEALGGHGQPAATKAPDGTPMPAPGQPVFSDRKDEFEENAGPTQPAPPPQTQTAPAPVEPAGEAPQVSPEIAQAIADHQKPAPTPATSPGKPGAAPPAPAAETPPVRPTTAEPTQDIAAQMQALQDPASPRDAVWVAKGTPVPKAPDGAKVVVRKEGVLITTNADKAKAFRSGPITDDKIQSALNIPESKESAAASGNPQVVQARTPDGAVQAEAVSSPENVPQAAQAVAAQAQPDATVKVTTPDAAQASRSGSNSAADVGTGLGNMGAEMGAGVSTSMRDMLWQHAQSGVTTEAGGPSNVLRAAKAIRDQGGLQTRPEFDQFVQDYGQTLKGGLTQDSYRALIERYLPTDQERARAAGADKPGVAGPTAPPNSKPAISTEVEASVATPRPQTPAEIRAARKAARAGVQFERGNAHVTEGEAADTTVPREDVTPEKVQAHAVKVVDVNPGVKLDGRVRSAIDGMVRAVSATSGTKPEIHEALDRWAAEQPAGRIPGTKTGYREAANKLAQLMTKEDLPSRRAYAQEAVSEGRRVEAGAAPKGGVETASEGALEDAEPVASVENPDEHEEEPVFVGHDDDQPPEAGAVDYGHIETQDFGPARDRSEQTTNMSRIASDLVNELANRTTTAQDAHERYGVDSGKGRPRDLPTMAHVLADELDKAEARRATAGADLAAAKPGRAGTLDSKAIIRATDEDRISAMREALEELGGRPADADEVLRKLNEKRAEQQARMAFKAQGKLAQVRRRIAQALSPEARARAKLWSSDELNSGIRNMAASNLAEDGHPEYSLHDYLNKLITSPFARKNMPELPELARYIKANAPNLRVYSPQQFLDSWPRDHDGNPINPRNYKLFEDGLDPNDPEHASGMFVPGNHAPSGEPSIVLDPDAHTSPAETIVHEAMHAITSTYLDRIGASTRSFLHEDSPLGGKHGDALRAIHKEMSDLFHEIAPGLGSGLRGDFAYALTNAHELHTMLMTHPELQALAGEHGASDAFRATMTKLGYGALETRSVWRGFVGLLRRIVGLPSDKVTNSILDNIIAPLTDITDTGAMFNRLHAPEPPDLATTVGSMLARPASDLGEGMPAPLGRRNRSPEQETEERESTFDKLAKLVDWKGAAEAPRRAWLASAPRDAIVKWNRDILPDIVAHRDAEEAISHVTSELRQKWAPKIRDMATRWKADGSQSLAQLMHDATLAGVHLDTADREGDNPAFAEGDAKKQLDELGARYDALPVKHRQLYNDIRQHYSDMYRAERNESIQSLIKSFVPEATEAQRDAFLKTARTRKGLEDFLANPDSGPVAQAFGDTWQGYRGILKGIADVHSRGFVQGDYFPLNRYGRYVVHYGDKTGDDYGVERFEKLGEAQRRRDQLKAQDVAGLSDVLDSREQQLREQLPSGLTDELAAAAKRNGMDDGQVDALRDLTSSVLLQHLGRSEMTRSRMRRKGVRGASLDVVRNLGRDTLGFTSRMGYLGHGVERTAAMQKMRLHADFLGRNNDDGAQRQASDVIRELNLRSGVSDDNTDGLLGWGRRATTLGFVHSIMSPSHMLLSTADTYNNAVPMLMARHGFRAPAALARAGKDALPSMTGAGIHNTLKAITQGLKAADWNLSTVVRNRMIAAGADKGHMTKLFDALNAGGLIDHTMIRELQRFANPTRDISRGWWDRFVDINAAGAHAVDVGNKTTVAKAAFDLEMHKNGGDVDGAVRYAVNTLRDVTPNYNYTNKPRITTDRGPMKGLSAPVMQFKNYGLHMYSLMAGLTRSALHGASKEERREAGKALLGILATHAMVAGSFTLIADPLRWLGGAYDKIMGNEGPHNYQNDLRQVVSDLIGKQAGEVFARGLPHLIGQDWHNRLGLANMLEFPELKSFKSDDVLAALGTMMVGAAGEDAAEMGGGIKQLLHGDGWGALHDLAPRVIRDPVTAGLRASEGIQDSKGRTTMAAKRISPLDTAYQSVGITPSNVSEFREGRDAKLEANAEAKEARTNLINAYTAAKTAEDREAVRKQALDYNREHPKNPLHVSSLISAARRAKVSNRARDKSSFGVSMTTKQQRDLGDTGSFANTTE